MAQGESDTELPSSRLRRRMSDSSLGAAVVATTQSARHLARRSSSRLWEERPQTPAGWTVFTTALLAAVVGYELQLQKQLTCPPYVFLQRRGDTQSNNFDNDMMQNIYERLTSNGGILAQAVQPSLWVGTRSSLASTLALVAGIPNSKKCFRFREIVTIPVDSAQLALDWEVPCDAHNPEKKFQRKSLERSHSKACCDHPPRHK